MAGAAAGSHPASLQRGLRGGGRLAAGTQKAANRPVLAGQRASLGARPGPGEKPGCTVELTEVSTGSEAWRDSRQPGTVDLLRGELQASAALVLAEVLQGGAELGMGHSRSYAEWLWQRSGAEDRKR